MNGIALMDWSDEINQILGINWNKLLNGVMDYGNRTLIGWKKVDFVIWIWNGKWT